MTRNLVFLVFVAVGCSQLSECPSGEATNSDKCRQYGIEHHCACGLDFMNKCMALCNGFTEPEIVEGKCNDFMCDPLQCGDENGFCNWYPHEVTDSSNPNTFCNVPPRTLYGRGAYCVKPALLRGCLQVMDTPVCVKSKGYPEEYFQFWNPCFAVSAGFPPNTHMLDASDNYADCETLGVDNDLIVQAWDSNNMESFGSPLIGTLGGLPWGTFIPFFEMPNVEDDGNCTYDYNPVCLKTGFRDFTFMNKCLAERRNATQWISPNQVYYPADFTIEEGECKEMCANYDCGENMVCASPHEGTAVCVPQERDLCQEECAKESIETVCVQAWRGANTIVSWDTTECYATKCLGFTKEFFSDSSCATKCLDACTPEMRNTEVCAFIDNQRVTQTECDVECGADVGVLFIHGPCDADDCVKSCAFRDRPVCVEGVTYLNFCEMQCALDDFDPATTEILDKACDTESPTSAPTAVPTEMSPTTPAPTFGMCDDVEGHPQYGGCNTYSLGQGNHKYCEEDGMKQVGKCPTACRMEGCIEEKSCDPDYPECCDTEHNMPSVFQWGPCSTYKAGEKNAGYCANDKVEDWCPFSCGLCKPVEPCTNPPAAPADGNVDFSNGNDKNSVATFSCNSGFKIQGSASVKCAGDGDWPAADVQCIESKECTNDKTWDGGYGMCATYFFDVNENNYNLCAVDGAYDLDAQTGPCCRSCTCTGDDPDFRGPAKYGSSKCEQYHSMHPKSQRAYCVSDGAVDACCFSCFADTGFKAAAACTSDDTFESEAGLTCRSYLPSGSRAGKCAADGVEETCCEACTCNGDDASFKGFNQMPCSHYAEGAPYATFCAADGATGPCCESCARGKKEISESQQAWDCANESEDDPSFLHPNYGGCANYGPSKGNHKFCNEDKVEGKLVSSFCCKSCAGA